MEQKQYKRQYRQLPQSVKDKISQSMRGKMKSPSHCAAISAGLKKAWEQIPNKPATQDDDSVL